MDNHHPKGPHTHIDDNEVDYNYTTDDKLLSDFEALVLLHLGIKL